MFLMPSEQIFLGVFLVTPRAESTAYLSYAKMFEYLMQKQWNIRS